MPSDWDDPSATPGPGDPTDPSRAGSTGGARSRRPHDPVAHVRVLLPGLVERRVPVRLVEHGPVGGVGRLRMGDGTTFLVASVDPMALGRVVRAMTAGRSVVISGWTETDDGPVLDLAEAGGRPPGRGRGTARRAGTVRVRVVGPDQPD
ncbi:hypothetical protein ACQE98_17285 [Ornithinimicrobium sp. W1679]|uniref:hypothetical protein n=1 Tax=Ornithinimicrobium sp. W1679 TaxID=3418770 RepID=UPI003CF2916D